MSIPNEVASEFAKLVTSNDSKETEQTVYGTIVLQDGVKYVRFDGSEILTPVSTTTNVENNERVTVLIKEHQAIVTGNITSPAARTQEVSDVNNKFDNYSTTEEMNSKISQTADSIKTEVNKTLSGYVTGDDVDDALKDHPTVAQMNSAIEQKAESITSTVNKTLEEYTTSDQLEEALGDYATDTDVSNALKNYPTKTEMNSAITQKADSITSEVNKTLTNYSTIEQTNTKVEQTAESLSAKITGMTIGGTNLFPDTRLMDTCWYDQEGAGRPVTRTTDNEGFTVVHFPAVESNSNVWSGVRLYAAHNIPYSQVRNKTVTLSYDWRSVDWPDGNRSTYCLTFYTRKSDGSNGRYVQKYFGKDASPQWSRQKHTYTITDDFFTASSGEIDDNTKFYITFWAYLASAFEIRKIKLELGNKATDWSPAPSDGAYSSSAVLDRTGIHLKTGGTFTVDSQNFDVDGQGKMTAKAGSIGGWTIAPGNLSSGSGAKHVRLSTEDATYAIWAGADASGSAPFRVTRDGKVYLTKLYVTDENGNAQANPVNLSGSWWRTNRAVQSMTVSGNTLTITLYDGTTVNFKKADGYGYITGLANGNTITIGGYKLNESGQGEIVDSGAITLTLDTENKKVNFSGGAGFKNFTAANGMDVTAMYNTGWNKCIDNCSYQSNVYTIIQQQPQGSPLYMKVGDSYTSVGTGWVRTAQATGMYRIPSKK